MELLVCNRRAGCRYVVGVLFRPRGEDRVHNNLHILSSLKFTPQTTYTRQDSAPLRCVPRLSHDVVEENSSREAISEHGKSDTEKQSFTLDAVQRRSYFSTLTIWNGTFSTEPLWKGFVQPYRLLRSPVLSTACLIDFRGL